MPISQPITPTHSTPSLPIEIAPPTATTTDLNPPPCVEPSEDYPDEFQDENWADEDEEEYEGWDAFKDEDGTIVFLAHLETRFNIYK